MTEQTTTERAGAESERDAGVWKGLRRLVGRWIGRVAEARTALERLQAALGDSELSAASCALSDLGGVAMPGGAADLALLRNHVDSYEYDEAQVLATRLLERLGGWDL
jgi:hypothetical protein